MEVIIENASKTIKQAAILTEINLRMYGGKVYGLQGQNGAGKTMLMRMIAGLIRPTCGNVKVNEDILGKTIDFPPSMGILIESPAFLPNYTGLRNLELLAGIQGRANDTQIRQALTNVGLNPYDKRKVRKYSLGMKQRLGIAAAIMEQPELILLDEPTNALDASGVKQIYDLICRERKRGALIVLASHDAEVLRNVSDEIFTIQDGRILIESRGDDIP